MGLIKNWVCPRKCKALTTESQRFVKACTAYTVLTIFNSIKRHYWLLPEVQKNYFCFYFVTFVDFWPRWDVSSQVLRPRSEGLHAGSGCKQKNHCCWLSKSLYSRHFLGHRSIAKPFTPLSTKNPFKHSDDLYLFYCLCSSIYWVSVS